MSEPRRFICGQLVHCPADRGEPAYRGEVVGVQPIAQKNHQGVEYFWVEVRHPRGTKHAWPSHRLG